MTMDQKAKEAFLDEDQWKRSVDHSLAYAKQCEGITRVVFCHTIEPFKIFVKLCYDDGSHKIMELTTTEECRTEFPKCEVLAETVFLASKEC